MNKWTKHGRRLLRLLRTTNGNPVPKMMNMGRMFSAVHRKPDRVNAAPVLIQFEPALVCNLDCPVCRPERRTDAPKNGRYMDVDAYKKLIDQVRGRTWYVDFTGDGESLLHPGIYEMFDYAVRNGMYTKLETNATRVDIDQVRDTGLQHIHVAVDGLTQETYTKYRVRGRWDKVKPNLERLVELRDRTGAPQVDVRFLVFRHNEHELAEAIQYFADLKVNANIQTPFLPRGVDNPTTLHQKWHLEVTPESFREWSSSLPEFTEYEFDADRGVFRHQSILGEFEQMCTGPWAGLNVAVDGSTLPCCVLSNDLEYSRGNMFEHGFEAVWNGDAFQQMRRQMRDTPAELSPCNICPANHHAKTIDPAAAHRDAANADVAAQVQELPVVA